MPKHKRKSLRDKIHHHPVAETMGWIGTSAIVIAYVLVTFNIISAKGFEYPLLNLIGAVGLIVIAEVKRLFQSVVLNIIWAIVAIIALVQLAFG